jgi:clan AA aspartic protease (TIGR02281 family)
MIADITVGDMTRRIPIMVQDDLPTDPLLGESFFNGFRYEIDNRAGFIHFVKTEGGTTKARIFEPTDVVAVPFTPAGNNMVVMAEVNGKPCEMYFDTGASGICFSTMSAMLLGIRIPADARPVMSGGVGGATTGYAFTIERIKLGPILKTNVPITVIQSGLPLPLLGQTFFGDRRFTIDNDKHVIKFAH